MKVCICADGESIHTQRWVNYFVNKGHQVFLISDRHYKYKSLKFFPLKNFFCNNLLNYLFHIYEVKRIINRINPDLVHALYISKYGALAAFSGFHPLILSPWGSDISVDPSRSRLYNFLIRYALKKADYVLTGVDSFKRRLIELGCKEKKIVFAPIECVDLSKFNPKKASNSLRKSFGGDKNFLVLNTCVALPIYRPEIFIKAIPLILKQIPNVNFILISGKKSAMPKEKLKRLIQDLGVQNQVKYVDYIPHLEMPSYLASVDLCVDSFIPILPIKPEDTFLNVGITPLESMACATPILMSDRNILPKSPELYYTSQNFQELADKIVKLLKSKKLRKKIESAIQTFVKQRVDEKRIMANWENFYKKVKKNF